jgi:DNA-3-methyladenine glycosylase I
MSEAPIRCTWACKTQIERDYHDGEWGTPLHDDQRLFEFLILEGAQAGLSWLTILRKRENYRRAFDHFDVQRVARFDQDKFLTLLENPGIVRNRMKIDAAIHNARRFLELQAAYGSFDAYLWRFVDGQPIQNTWRAQSEAPTRTIESDHLSKDLQQRGFKFVGTTICYAFMQAVGMVNDHIVDCFRWQQLRMASPPIAPN